MAFYNEPSDPNDLKGSFLWTYDLAVSCSPSLRVRHACHEREMREALAGRAMHPRSAYDALRADKSTVALTVVWASFNNFIAFGNNFGPLIFATPVVQLVGRHFYVFARKENGRMRYVFLEYNVDQPIYDAANIESPQNLLKTESEGLDRVPNDIYNFALQSPLSLIGATLEGEEHQQCIGSKCAGMTRHDADQFIAANRSADLHQILKQSNR